MRAVGNALAEFSFHDFGAAEMVMLRDGDRLTSASIPSRRSRTASWWASFDTRPLDAPPAGSVWSSLDELHEPLVECYDALGVDARAGAPLHPHHRSRSLERALRRAGELYCEYFDTGPLGRGAASSTPCCTSRSAGIAGGRCGGWRWVREAAGGLAFHPFRNG